MPSTIRREDVWVKSHVKKNGEVPTAFIADCVSKIQEFKSSRTSPGTSLPINEDALSHTLEPERNGRVGALGFGMTPSLVGIHMNSSKKVQALENMVSDLTNKVGDLQNLIIQHCVPMGNENINTPSPRSQNITSRGNDDNVNTPSSRSLNNENHKGTTRRLGYGDRINLYGGFRLAYATQTFISRFLHAHLCEEFQAGR